MVEAQLVSPRVSALSPTEIRQRLVDTYQQLATPDWPPLALEGKLLRPQVAVAVASGLAPHLLEDSRFWSATLAVQMAHEASLAHDDIIDQAKERRGNPTIVASKGIGAALLQGDHLLTASYRAVAHSGNASLMTLFAQAVERTVAGESLQARKRKQLLAWETYHQIVVQKTGYLFGFAFSIAPLLLHHPQSDGMVEAGCELGSLYQMLDDLLDYCSLAQTGKPPFQDYLQKKCTWPLLVFSETPEWGWEPETLRHWMFDSEGREPPKSAILLRFFVDSCTALEERVRELFGNLPPTLHEVLWMWQEVARESLIAEEAYFATQSTTATMQVEEPVEEVEEELLEVSSTDRDFLQQRLHDEGLLSADALQEYFEHHSRSFSFASLFFPAAQRQQIARIYAWCRFTDDIADDPDLSTEESRRLLTLWKQLCKQAYRGQATGIEFLDGVMKEMAERHVPFRYAEELIAGMEMDLTRNRYKTLEELHLYCYRVASTVGLWLTELFGVHDSWVLERATALGYAMQLTNILRDVGEDLERGRVYLPKELLDKHGVSIEQLQRLSHSDEPMPYEYKELQEELLTLAERYYRKAFHGIPFLPSFFQKPVFTAAFVYRGIHREIRGNQYDNLRKRAHTSLWSKVKLATLALWELRKENQRAALRHDAKALPTGESSLNTAAPSSRS